MATTEADGDILVCGFCSKNQNEVRAMVAGPSVSICDECIDVLTDVVGEERKQATITRSANLASEWMHPAAVLLSGFADHLRVRQQEEVVLSIRRDGTMIGLEVRHAAGRREAVAGALADYGLIVTGAAEAGPAERRVLDAARAAFGEGAPPGAGDALARKLSILLSDASMLVMKLQEMAGQAEDAAVRDALDALRAALERGFGPGAEAEIRARLAVIGARAPAVLARIREVAERSRAAGGGALLVSWIAVPPAAG